MDVDDGQRTEVSNCSQLCALKKVLRCSMSDMMGESCQLGRVRSCDIGTVLHLQPCWTTFDLQRKSTQSRAQENSAMQASSALIGLGPASSQRHVDSTTPCLHQRSEPSCRPSPSQTGLAMPASATPPSRSHPWSMPRVSPTNWPEPRTLLTPFFARRLGILPQDRRSDLDRKVSRGDSCSCQGSTRHRA